MSVNNSSQRAVYLEKEPTPMAQYETVEDAREIQQTLEKVSDELYGEENPFKITQVDEEVRVFGDGGYEIVKEAGKILETPFFESRNTAREILEETAENYKFGASGETGEVGTV